MWSTLASLQGSHHITKLPLSCTEVLSNEGEKACFRWKAGEVIGYPGGDPGAGVG